MGDELGAGHGFDIYNLLDPLPTAAGLLPAGGTVTLERIHKLGFMAVIVSAAGVGASKADAERRLGAPGNGAPKADAERRLGAPGISVWRDGGAGEPRTGTAPRVDAPRGDGPSAGLPHETNAGLKTLRDLLLK
jgi:hypothetical protein